MNEQCGCCLKSADLHDPATGACPKTIYQPNFFRLFNTGSGGKPGSPPADTRWPRPSSGGASAPSGKTWYRRDMEPGDAFRYVKPDVSCMPTSNDSIVVTYPGMPLLGASWYKSNGAGSWPDWEVTPIQRFDGFLSERFRGHALKTPRTEPIEWPHKCDRCGAPGLYMAVSIVCSKACCKDRK